MRVLFFAQLQDVTGCEAWELPSRPSLPSLTASQLWDILLEQFPALASHKKSIRIARNWEYAVPETQFSGDDEVALIPPVSGG